MHFWLTLMEIHVLCSGLHTHTHKHTHTHTHAHTHTHMHTLNTHRDSRIELERAADAAWERLVLAVYKLERLEHEQQRLGEGLE